MSLGDLDVIRHLVESDPSSLDRRMSRHEGGMAPLHLAIARGRHDIVELLVELGVDLEAVDGHGLTALATAMLEGREEAARLLRLAGASLPPRADVRDYHARTKRLAKSVRRGTPAISVADIGVALDWYVSIGFTETGRYEQDGLVVWGMVSFGEAMIAFGLDVPRNPAGPAGRRDASLWFETTEIEALYELLRSMQLENARAALDGGIVGGTGIRFEEHLYRPFYGGRQFSIRDPDGYDLIFHQPE
jgi:hypothetical protein